MKAVLLAAGRSTRLYPLTASLPKCLLTVGNKAIIDHQIEALLEAGIKELILVIGFQKELIVEHLARKNYPLQITYVENTAYETSGPINSLRFAKQYLEGSIIFFHCDVLFEKSAIAQLLDHPDGSVMLYREAVWDNEAGKIIVDAAGRVREVGKHIEEERSSGEYLQVAKFSDDFVKCLVTVLDERIEAGRDTYTIDAFNDVIQDNSIPVTGLSFKGIALEIDTPEDYITATETWTGQ